MLDLLQDLVNVEAGRLLPLREPPIHQSTLFILCQETLVQLLQCLLRCGVELCVKRLGGRPAISIAGS